jgi:putative ABC transport system ATP-binding protein
VFQSLNLVMSLSALDNVLLPARIAHLVPRGHAARRDSLARARTVLDRLGISGHVQARRASLLSGGERQRVAVARVLFNRPEVVFADEPTGALDSASGNLVLGELQRLSQAGSTVVLVTHDLEAACRAHRALVLRDGVLAGNVQSPTPDQLLALADEHVMPAVPESGAVERV